MTYANDDIAAAVSRALRRDPPQPDDAGRTPEKYVRLSRDFRAGAWKHLREDGDLPQASSKAWGMVAQTVKAVSAHHGGIIHAHGSIWLVVRELAGLAEAAGDLEASNLINNAFRTARALHSNYYEDEETAAEIADGLALCEELSGRLYELFWPEGGAMQGGIMGAKLQQGDRLPETTLNLIDGATLALPEAMSARYLALLFYRGVW